MKKLISWALNKGKKFTVLDWGLLKLVLFSGGTLFGVIFAKYLKPFITGLVFIFMASYATLMFRFCKK